jgi:hypothetical protein
VSVVALGGFDIGAKFNKDYDHSHVLLLEGLRLIKEVMGLNVVTLVDRLGW